VNGRVTIDLDAGAAAAPEVIAVMHAAFAEYARTGQPSGAMTETVESLRGEVAAGTRLALVRRDGVAVASAKHERTNDGALYFGRLAVIPEARGQGWAGTLVRALREHARASGLAGLTCLVRADEPGNIALYERLGMVVSGRGEKASRTGAILAVVEMRDTAVR
jgi:ribosomal protein S18 acetylase RimI-like enzyme